MEMIEHPWWERSNCCSGLKGDVNLKLEMCNSNRPAENIQSSTPTSGRIWIWTPTWNKVVVLSVYLYSLSLQRCWLVVSRSPKWFTLHVEVSCDVAMSYTPSVQCGRSRPTNHAALFFCRGLSRTYLTIQTVYCMPAPLPSQLLAQVDISISLFCFSFILKRLNDFSVCYLLLCAPCYSLMSQLCAIEICSNLLQLSQNYYCYNIRLTTFFPRQCG